jgi:acetyl-CoA synthetase
MRIRSWEEYLSAADRARRDPADFWGEMARGFQWMRPFETVCEADFAAPRIEWFQGGVLNITENCLDRHLAAGDGDRCALRWEPNAGEGPARSWSYRELSERVCALAAGLQRLGVAKGDRVILYLPMVPEAVVAMLACARLGAIHAVVFAGFSAQALADRIQDAGAKWVITADGLRRGDRRVGLKALVDEALTQVEGVERVVVLEVLGEEVAMRAGRDVTWASVVEGMPRFIPAAPMQSEDVLFILYTSGSTGKPKGVVHTTAGYMVYTAYSFCNVFQWEPGDVFWCTADVGWVTGHSYTTYGPLLMGATTLLFEGIPTYPHAGRCWEVIEKHGVTHFYTAPTAIRALMAHGDEPVAPFEMPTLRVLGSVGEPINEEAWHWYYERVGRGRCALVDTWWQTETGGIMISGLAGLSPEKPGHAGWPLPGIEPVIVDADGHPILTPEAQGHLCVAAPWPSMLRTTYGDHERCRTTYFASHPGMYFTGDGARRDAQGMYRIIGRVDDVINVSGHRLGTAEIESAINSAPDIVESAVVGFPHPIKGTAIYAFVVSATAPEDEIRARQAIQDEVVAGIGALARPEKIQFVPALPKTRSGKIMRRILRKIAAGETEGWGDTSTLLDPEVVEIIRRGAQ